MTEEQFEAAMRTVQPEIKDGDLTEKQFEAAMRTFRLELEYWRLKLGTHHLFCYHQNLQIYTNNY